MPSGTHSLFRLIRRSFIVSVFFIIAHGCAVNPVTGKRELSIISPEQEVSMGKKNYIPYQQQQGGAYSVDPNLSRYVTDVGKKLVAVSDRPGLPYEFAVINNSVPNAWALPGGKIAVNRGLLTLLEDEAQLAAVLAHEIVHAAAKHSVQKMQQDMILGITIQAASAATQNTGYGDTIAAGAGLGAGLWSAKYGRSQELQSDEVGMRYMKAAGYDPLAAVELQETFVRLSQQSGNSAANSLFASHPPSKERVSKNTETAKALGVGGNRNRAQYQKAINQITKDADAYKQFDSAVKKAVDGDLPGALGLIDKAIKQQPDESLFHATRGQILLAQKRYSNAESAFLKAKQINPDYYLSHLGLGLGAFHNKRMSAAKTHLLASAKLLPTQTAIFHLGEAELALGNTEQAIAYFQSAAQQGGELGGKAQARLDALQPPTTQSTTPAQIPSSAPQ